MKCVFLADAFVAQFTGILPETSKRRPGDPCR
jgi:hypothetical protein